MKAHIELFNRDGQIEVTYEESDINNNGIPFYVYYGIGNQISCDRIKNEYQDEIIKDISEMIEGLSDEWELYNHNGNECGRLTDDGLSYMEKIKDYLRDLPECYYYKTWEAGDYFGDKKTFIEYYPSIKDSVEKTIKLIEVDLENGDLPGCDELKGLESYASFIHDEIRSKNQDKRFKEINEWKKNPMSLIEHDEVERMRKQICDKWGSEIRDDELQELLEYV